MFRKTTFLLISLLFLQAVSYAEPISGAEILRSQELIQKDESWRQKIKEEKFFIKKILIKGVTILSEDTLKEIILPFEKKWLTKGDIQEMLDAIKQAYKKAGLPEEKIKLSSQLKKRTLEIIVEEFKKP